MTWPLVALSVVVLTSIAQAQSAPAPIYFAGESWTRSDGLTARIVRADPTGVVWTGLMAGCPSCRLHFGSDGELLAQTDAEDKPVSSKQPGIIFIGGGWRFYHFPLEINKTWSIRATAYYGGLPFPYEIWITVKAYENVKTQAGTFKAFRIEQEWNTKFMGTSAMEPIRWLQVVWFAPEVKAEVKFTSNFVGSASREWELVSYKLRSSLP